MTIGHSVTTTVTNITTTTASRRGFVANSLILLLLALVVLWAVQLSLNRHFGFNSTIATAPTLQLANDREWLYTKY